MLRVDVLRVIATLRTRHLIDVPTSSIAETTVSVAVASGQAGGPVGAARESGVGTLLVE
ncbi:MAG: hypothetical protein QM736_00480 [Vicinamibacterales bacterium]